MIFDDAAGPGVIPTEVKVDEQAGLDHFSVVSCDNVTTVPKRLCVHRRGSKRNSVWTAVGWPGYTAGFMVTRGDQA